MCWVAEQPTPQYLPLTGVVRGPVGQLLPLTPHPVAVPEAAGRLALSLLPLLLLQLRIDPALCLQREPPWKAMAVLQRYEAPRERLARIGLLLAVYQMLAVTPALGLALDAPPLPAGPQLIVLQLSPLRQPQCRDKPAKSARPEHWSPPPKAIAQALVRKL